MLLPAFPCLNPPPKTLSLSIPHPHSQFQRNRTGGAFPRRADDRLGQRRRLLRGGVHLQARGADERGLHYDHSPGERARATKGLRKEKLQKKEEKIYIPEGHKTNVENKRRKQTSKTNVENNVSNSKNKGKNNISEGTKTNIERKVLGATFQFPKRKEKNILEGTKKTLKTKRWEQRTTFNYL